MQLLPFSLRIPERALLLFPKEASSRIETSTLRALGVPSITHRYSVASALLLLKEAGTAMGKAPSDPPAMPFDCILCDQDFGDGHLFSFLLQLIKIPYLSRLPLLIVTASEGAVHTTAKCHIPVISRPYAQNALGKALTQCMSPSRQHVDIQALKDLAGAAKSAEKIYRQEKKPRPLTTSDIMRKGMLLFKRGDADGAEQEFLTVLRRQEEHVEANLALARIYQSRGDLGARNAFLIRAAAACERSKKPHHAATIKALLPEKMQQGNILLQEAFIYARAGKYRHAALGLVEYCDAHPHLQEHTVFARASLKTPDPQASMDSLCDALDRLGHKDRAKKIRQRLFMTPGSTAPALSSWLDRFPLLHDVVSVASHTARVWRHA